MVVVGMVLQRGRRRRRLYRSQVLLLLVVVRLWHVMVASLVALMGKPLAHVCLELVVAWKIFQVIITLFFSAMKFLARI